MAQNYIQPGEVIDYIVPSSTTFAAGDVVLAGTIVGIALGGGTEGETIPVKVTGVFEVAKTTGEAWTVGALVYWDSSEEEFTTTSSGNTLAGKAVAAAGSSDTTGLLKLTES